MPHPFRAVVLALIFAFPLSATATDPRVASEYRRLTEQLVSYADRTAWPAVARTFAELEALEGAPITAQDLYLGAQAARSLGDALTCRRRLLRAFEKLDKAATFDPKAARWLGELQSEYGHVQIRTKGAEPELRAVNPPFQPDRQAAIQFAATRLKADRTFDGLLPAGEYTVGTYTFTVEAGTDIERHRFRVKQPK